MENAADALKIAFAVFAFALAITILFSLVAQAKSTADYIFYYGDRTNYYENRESGTTKYRKVKVEDVISTLYRYYKESICITFDLGTDSKTFDQSLNEGKTTESIENEIAEYVNGTLLLNYSNKKFDEIFTEVPTSGIYDEGGDGTEIVVSSGGKKVYITYRISP